MPVSESQIPLGFKEQENEEVPSCVVACRRQRGSASAGRPCGTAATCAGSRRSGTQQKKVIQDPNEYNAYVAAVNATDPAQKAQLMESYLQTYPNSVMKEDGLELLLKTYQQLNNAAQIKATAQRLLQVNPNNLTALALLSYLDRAQAQAGGADAAAALQEAGQLGARGLQAMQTATKPEGYTDEQWNTMKNSFRVIYLGSVGHAALQAKDYPTAQQNLKEVVAAQPTDVNSIYLLALAYLSPKPPVVDGLFWIAKAAAVRIRNCCLCQEPVHPLSRLRRRLRCSCWPGQDRCDDSCRIHGCARTFACRPGRRHAEEEHAGEALLCRMAVHSYQRQQGCQRSGLERDQGQARAIGGRCDRGQRAIR